MVSTKPYVRIDLIDPADGKTVETLIHSRYFSLEEFKVLSSGEIVCPEYTSFTVIDNSKSEAKVKKYDINLSLFYEHKLTADTLINVLYHGYSSHNRRGFAVDQIFSDNAMKAQEIITLPSWTDVNRTSMVITPSGKLVLMHREEILVFAHSA